ncbi:MAG: hypothetical protein UX10_C0006G0014 [Candidatus Magasanikbacteria bacterium GW2011_GWA2_45_39]|uniref:Glycosyltransferase RgtA/B/C/D-like domain-containing protein n=1 Tax=Candidatus Magasanikbacteria bacterium GW2011_GWA2_45_39 TaxID=1619041 RepID=A0A0G1PQM7_9BACT|nr:MAG: hypothetical protein UX10_C0006G0014 [Candidatus Magasanikbacteria bacterium GW2011_GWA2_45_39]
MHKKDQLKIFFREHRLILGVAVILATLMIFPLVLFPLSIPKTYQGINIANHGLDELWYLSRGKEILDGHELGNPLFREGKNEQDPYFTYVEHILLSPVKWLGLGDMVSIPTLYALFNAGGVFILILLIYFFTLQLSSDKILSTVAATLIVGGYALVHPSDLFSINVYSRAFSPYIPLLATFGYANLLLRAVRRTSQKYIFLSGLVFGLLFYVYFYAWSYIAAVNGCLFFIYLARREFILAKKIFLISILGISIGSFSLLNLVSSAFSEAGKQLAYFHWVEHSRAPFIDIFSLAVAFIFTFFALKKRCDANFAPLLAFVVAGWLVMNQQILTGKSLQSGHFIHFTTPFSVIIVGIILWPLLKKDIYKKLVCVGFLVMAFVNTGIGQYRAAITKLDTKEYYQNYRPIIDALNEDKKPGVILAADNFNQYLFTVFTPHDLFWARGFLVVNVPLEERTKDALFVYMYLNREARVHFVAYLTSQLKEPSKLAIYSENPIWFYGGIYETLEGYKSGMQYYDYQNSVSDGLGGREIQEKRPLLLESLAKEYDLLAKHPEGILQLFKKYGINYIVWDKNKNSEWDLGFIQKELVVESHNIFLYHIK